jgi:predicted nucleic acid-binding protein
LLVHVDTGFLVYALSVRGPERKKLDELVMSETEIEISAVAWYEFSRGPRTPEQLAVARLLFGSDGIVPFSEGLAAASAEVFRSLGSPRKRAADIAIGVTAAAAGAALLTRNAKDFSGVPGLKLETIGS